MSLATQPVRPPAAEAPPAPEAIRPRPGPHRPRVRIYLPWMRLVALVAVAVATQGAYLGFWPLSYYLTQSPGFTYEYLVQYQAVWARLIPLLSIFEALLPGGNQSLDVLVETLVRLFVVVFGLYLVGFGLVQGGLPRRWGTIAVVAPALAFQTSLFLMPGLFTTDLFSYTMYGHIAGGLGRNPFTAIPSAFPDVRMLAWIHPLWHDAPSIYGPAWVSLTVPLGRTVASWTDVDKVLAYKLVVNVAHLASIAIVALTVHRLRPGRTLETVMLYAWNPLLLFEYGGNGHNDAAMVAVMLLGLLLYATRAPWLGLVALCVSFLVKMSSVLLVPYYTIAWAREQRPIWRFFGVGFLAVATLVGVVVAFYAPWWQGMQTVDPIVKWSQGPMFLNYVPDVLAQYLARERYLVPGGPPSFNLALDETRADVKWYARVAFGIYAAWELWWARGGRGIAASGARVMLAFLLVMNTWVLPWYFSWPLALALVAGWDTLTGKVLVLFSLTAPAVMYHRHFWNPYQTDVSFAVYLLPLALVPMYALYRLMHLAPYGWRTLRSRQLAATRSGARA